MGVFSRWKGHEPIAVIHVQAPMVTVNVPEDRRHLRQGCQVFEALRATLPLPGAVFLKSTY